MKISVLIPSKNEPLLRELTYEIHKNLKSLDHEVIIVEFGEIEEIPGAKVIKQKSKGLGNAIMEGLNHAKGDVIVTIDGDFSHRPEDILKLLKKINSFDIVIGSRFVKGGLTNDKTHRRLISWVYRNFASLVLGLKIKDNMSGFAAIKREVYDNLRINPLGFKINLEIMYKAKKKGYKIYEVPIVFEKRKAGKPKSSASEAFRIIRYIFELKFGLR
ncbi:MAG: glycosyltransferase [Candidatus Aenigmarchaeota archaeon]|nr:glycosyltransferase [Candidatus Aenigmarchaeota archaeon]